MTPTAQDRQRIDQDYYLPFKRQVRFYLNGNFKSEGTVVVKHIEKIEDAVSLMIRQSAKRWNCNPSDITVEY